MKSDNSMLGARASDESTCRAVRVKRVERLTAELQPDEKLLWTGYPDARRMAMKCFGLWLFAIPWTVFSLFFEGIALLAPIDFIVKLVMGIFGLPFVAIGIGMLLSPYLAWCKGNRTLYAITNTRVLIAEFGNQTSIKSHSPDECGTITRTDIGNGRSDLIFLKSSDSDGNVSYTGFIGIENAREAEAMLRKYIVASKV